jgi:hypothetical protein
LVGTGTAIFGAAAGADAGFCSLLQEISPQHATSTMATKYTGAITFFTYILRLIFASLGPEIMLHKASKSFVI